MSSAAYHVNEELLSVILRVVPVTVVDPHSEQFNGWLGAVDLLGGHIQVVHKDDTLFARRWAKDTSTASV